MRCANARYGRKVRLKIGEIEAEAQTREEVEKLLARAQEIQQRNQPPLKPTNKKSPTKKLKGKTPHGS